ncbi:MAG: hypothetical protein EXS50_01620 [Candidatus Taylorbacteria bacterium]|nr:hypothetical protein [Candidatus Taylorbacteria bacterium]
MHIKKSVIAETYAKRNHLTVEQLEQSMLRYTGKDGDFLTLLANIIHVVFRSWITVIIVIGSITVILWGHALLGVITLSTCLVGFCSFFYIEWKVEQANNTMDIWKKFEKLLEEFSRVTTIPTCVMYSLSEAELREIAGKCLKQLANEIKGAERASTPKDKPRDEFKKTHSTLYLLGLAEGRWSRYFSS